MRRQVLLQELHLVGENAAVGEDQVLGLVRNVGRVEQLQAGLLRQAVALVPVAVPAGGDDVHPGVAPAARQRRDVVARQPEVAELAAAVRAHVAVAPEQLAVVDRKSTRLNSSHSQKSYAAFCFKKKKQTYIAHRSTVVVTNCLLSL